LAVFDDGSGAALFVGGDFSRAGGKPTHGIARWDGKNWSALGDGLEVRDGTLEVFAMTVFDDHSGGGPSLFVGGVFDSAGGKEVHNIAKWDGKEWSDVGDGVSGNGTYTAGVHCMLAFGRDGDQTLAVGGNFLYAGGSEMLALATWNGRAWSPFTFTLTGISLNRRYNFHFARIGHQSYRKIPSVASSPPVRVDQAFAHGKHWPARTI
jgi:hypothetical protein